MQEVYQTQTQSKEIFYIIIILLYFYILLLIVKQTKVSNINLNYFQPPSNQCSNQCRASQFQGQIQAKGTARHHLLFISLVFTFTFSYISPHISRITQTSQAGEPVFFLCPRGNRAEGRQGFYYEFHTNKNNRATDKNKKSKDKC